MKYVKSYLVTACVLTGFYYVAYVGLQAVYAFVQPEDVLKYLLFLGIVTGIAGPIALYLEENNAK